MLVAEGEQALQRLTRQEAGSPQRLQCDLEDREGTRPGAGAHEEPGSVTVGVQHAPLVTHAFGEPVLPGLTLGQGPQRNLTRQRIRHLIQQLLLVGEVPVERGGLHAQLGGQAAQGQLAQADFAQQRGDRNDHPAYRTSPLSLDLAGHRKPVHAGDVAPDSPVLLDTGATHTRLFDLFRGPYGGTVQT
jgi:hypothetical protein